MQQILNYSLARGKEVNMNTTELAEKVIFRFGHDAQQKMLVEEMAELTTAICHLYRGRDSKDNLAEEIADCLTVLSQMDIIFKTAPKRNDAYHPSWSKDIPIFEQIIFYAGKLQSALIVYPKYVSGGLSIRELLIQFRETLNTLAEEVGIETINEWMDKKNDRMCERLSFGIGE